MTRDRWTGAEIERVLKMRALGLTLREIAPVFSTNTNALKQVLWRHRHGIRSGQADDVARVRAAVVEAAEGGQVNAREIARQVGVPYHRATRLLRGAGFDREVRELYARGS